MSANNFKDAEFQTPQSYHCSIRRCQFSKKDSSEGGAGGGSHGFMSNSVESFSDDPSDATSEFVPGFRPKKKPGFESSFLELPTLKHVSKAFRIELWFLTNSPGEFILNFSQLACFEY